MNTLNIGKLRVAGILDELSCFCFPYECEFLNLDYDNWEKQLESFRPELLFIESAWHGYKNKWYTKIYNLDSELTGVINTCRRQGIPTVFWNKEDPVHFDTFLGTAKLCDYVYTTDLDCVSLYKRLLGHDNVGVLLFAAEPRKFNPMEKYARSDACCFAGSYFALQKERCADFENIFDVCSDTLGFDIYDRNIYPGNPDYTFPEKYQSRIKGSLPPDRIDYAYKGYRWNVTMNTVKRSSTMEARRIFELLACNTLSISNPCSAVKNLFGELVTVYEDRDSFFSRINKLDSDRDYADKLRLAALRKVMSEHTYAHRIREILADVTGEHIPDGLPSVCIFAFSSNEKETEYIIKSFRRQNYRHSSLAVITSYDAQAPMDDRITFVKNGDAANAAELAKSDFFAYFSPNNYYGADYLTDIMLAVNYTNASVIGKKCRYSYSDGGFTVENDGKSYINTDSLPFSSSAFSRDIAEDVPLGKTDFENGILTDCVCTSVDRFSFCLGFTGDECPAADGIEPDCGCSVDDIRLAARNISADDSLYEIQTVFTGKEFIRNADYDTAEIMEVDSGEDTASFYTLSVPRYYMMLTDEFDVSAYTNDGFIRVFFDGLSKGEAKVGVIFTDENGENIKISDLPPKRYMRYPVPGNAVKFRFRYVSSKGAVLYIKQIVINAFPDNGTDIDRFTGGIS